MFCCSSAVFMGNTIRTTVAILVLTSAALTCVLASEEVTYKYAGNAVNRSQAEVLCAAQRGVLPAPQSLSAHVRLGDAITAAGKDRAWLQLRRHEIKTSSPGGLERKPSRCAFYHASGESNHIFNSSCHATHVKNGRYFWSLCRKPACTCNLAFAKSRRGTCLRISGYCVFFGDSHTSWLENKMYCHAYGMQMVAATEKVLQSLNEGISQQSSLRTGRLYPLDYRTHVHTADDGKEPEESFWSEDDDNSTSDCVAYMYYAWAPIACAEELPVICEIQVRGNHSETNRTAEAYHSTQTSHHVSNAFLAIFVISTVVLGIALTILILRQRAKERTAR